MDFDKTFNGMANTVSKWAGRPLAFILCLSLVVVWAVCGPIFKFSEVWQLVINTSTTIITFLMVFLIQNTQNRDNAALQAKLDELIRVSRGENRFIGIEQLTDKELESILDDASRHAPELRAQDKPETKPRSTTARKSTAAQKKPATTTRRKTKAPAAKTDRKAS